MAKPASQQRADRRQRAKAGLTDVRLPCVPHAFIAQLVEAGLLQEWDEGNRKAVALAISKWIATAACPLEDTDQL